MLNTNEKIARFFNRLKSKDPQENKYDPKITDPIRMRTITPTANQTFNEVYQNTIKNKKK